MVEPHPMSVLPPHGQNRTGSMGDNAMHGCPWCVCGRCRSSMGAHDYQVGMLVMRDGQDAVTGAVGAYKVFNIASGETRYKVLQLSLGGSNGFVGEVDSFRDNRPHRMKCEQP